MSPTTRRRIVLASLVTVCTVNACTSLDVACDMRTDYAWESPEATEGVVTIRWRYGQDAYLPANVNGTTECWGLGDARFCLIRMRGRPESFHNVCGMAKQRHEEKHAMGAKHEQ